MAINFKNKKKIYKYNRKLKLTTIHPKYHNLVKNKGYNISKIK